MKRLSHSALNDLMPRAQRANAKSGLSQNGMYEMAMERVRAIAARYIKLGEAGEWAERCIAEGTLRLGYYEAPHEAGLRGDGGKIRQAYADRHKTTASRYAGEV